MMAPLNAYAHRMDSAMTIIDVAPNGQNIEITHRIFAHDLEHVFELSQTNLNYFETESGKQKLKNYIENAFSISNNGQKIQLTFIGVELAGDLVFVYFEGDIGNATEVTIDNNILKEYSQRQVNYLNLHFNGQTKSLIFQNGQQAQTLQLR